MINKLCFQALSLGFVRKARRIGLGIMREVLADMHLTEPSIQLASRADATGDDTEGIPIVFNSESSNSSAPAEVQTEPVKIQPICYSTGRAGTNSRFLNFLASDEVQRKTRKILSSYLGPGKTGADSKSLKFFASDGVKRKTRKTRKILSRYFSPGKTAPLVPFWKHLWQRHWMEIILSSGLFLGLVSAGLFIFYLDPPPDGLSQAPAPTSLQNLTITVQPNETLNQLVMNHTGSYPDPGLLKAILALNPQIADPDKIQTGDLIRLPPGLEPRIPVPSQSRSNNTP